MLNKGKRKVSANQIRGVRLVTLLVVCALGVAAFAWKQERDEIFLPIRYVRVEGSIQYLDTAGLRQALLPAVNAGYFSVNMPEIEAAAKSFPWVDGVQVVRLWPDTLVLRINEHKAVVRWGDYALLNQRGERFAPGGREAFRELPVIYGPPGMENYLLGMLNSLNDKLRNNGMSVASLALSKRRAWIAKLTSGMEIHFGRQDPLTALDRFLQLIPKLGEERMAEVQRLDLRYPNGFAVVWRPDDTSSDGAPSASRSAGFRLIGNGSNLALETIYGNG